VLFAVFSILVLIPLESHLKSSSAIRLCH
jgi:hypothetical protein